MKAKGKIDPDSYNECDYNNVFSTSSAVFSELKSNRNSIVHLNNVEKFSTNRDIFKNCSDISKALYADRNHSKSKKVIF